MKGFESIGGDTYPVKEDLKRLGARWDAALRVWWVPESNANAARLLVASVRRNELPPGWGSDAESDGQSSLDAQIGREWEYYDPYDDGF